MGVANLTQPNTTELSNNRQIYITKLPISHLTVLLSHSVVLSFFLTFESFIVTMRTKSEVDGANPHFGSYLTCNMSFGYPTLGSSLYKDPMRPPFPLNYLIPSLPIITALA